MSKPIRPQSPAALARKTTDRPLIQQKRASPAAPPAYRPQPTPKVLQRKTPVVAQRPSPLPDRQPSPPPVYCPQPTPKVLQTKKAIAHRSPEAAPPRRPAAPPVYRPEQMRLLQPKATPGTPVQGLPVGLLPNRRQPEALVRRGAQMARTTPLSGQPRPCAQPHASAVQRTANRGLAHGGRTTPAIHNQRGAIQRMLTTQGLTGNYLAATQLFEQALQQRNDQMYALSDQAPGRFAIFVEQRQKTDNSGDQAYTYISYKNPPEEIYGPGVDNLDALTLHTVTQRGLAIKIVLLEKPNEVRPKGAILQNLTHEYGGHASLLFPYVATLLDEQTAQQGLQQLQADRTQPLSNLSQITHHYHLALNNSGAYNNLRGRIARTQFGSSEVGLMNEFYDQEETDVMTLRVKGPIDIMEGVMSNAISNQEAGPLLGQFQAVNQSNYTVSNAYVPPLQHQPTKKLPTLEPQEQSPFKDYIPKEWKPF